MRAATDREVGITGQLPRTRATLLDHANASNVPVPDAPSATTALTDYYLHVDYMHLPGKTYLNPFPKTH